MFSITYVELSMVRYEGTSGIFDEDKLLTVRKTRTKDDIHYILDTSKTNQLSNLHHQHKEERRSNMSTLKDSKYLTLPPHLINKSSSSSSTSTRSVGELLIDGGCDTSLCGNGFVVESTTERKVNVQGFNSDMKITHLPVVTAIAAVTLMDETIIIEVNEAIYVKGNRTSLLSTFQAREFGVQVHDTARRHGGRQSVVADGYEIPLLVKNGLMVLPVREPTSEEASKCTRVVLTSDQPWDVQVYGEDTDENDVVRANFFDTITSRMRLKAFVN